MDLSQVLYDKHMHGQKKYHAFSFLEDGRDMRKESIEELVDAINYMTYQEIKDEYDEKEIRAWDVHKFNNIYKEKILNLPEASTSSSVKSHLIYLINKLKEDENI